MLRSALASVLIAAVCKFASAAHAATSPPGVNLRWDNCFGDGGVWNKTFACDTNAGSEWLVGSFVLDNAVQEVSGIEFYVDIGAAAPALPAWWDFKTAGSCRTSSLGFSLALPLSSSCVEWSNGAAAGGIAGYSVAPHGPSTSRIIGGLAVASQDLATLDAGVEYGFGTITINHQKTAGAGACGGCTTPVCIFLSRVQLDFPPVTGQPSRDILLERGANFVGSQYVTWQGGYPVNVQVQCDVPALSCGQHYTGFDCVLATPTWLRGSTWGQVKSLYRQLAPDSPDSRPRP